MSSETTMVAEECRLQEWAAQIRDCQNRPAGMSIVSWCACHGITKANYYYRLRRVREACLESISGENPPHQIIPVSPEILRVDEKNRTDAQPGLDISIRGFSVLVHGPTARNGPPGSTGGSSDGKQTLCTGYPLPFLWAAHRPYQRIGMGRGRMAPVI